MPTLGGLYAWEMEKDGRELNVRVDALRQAHAVADKAGR